MINQVVHDERKDEQDLIGEFEKNPSRFGIDIHFDDFDDFAEKEYIYKIDPKDSSWTDKVKQGINEKSKNKPADC